MASLAYSHLLYSFYSTVCGDVSHDELTGNSKAPHPDLTFACPGTWLWLQWIQWIQWVQAGPPRTHCARSSRSWCPWFLGFCLSSHGLELNIPTSARTDLHISRLPGPAQIQSVAVAASRLTWQRNAAEDARWRGHPIGIAE